MSAPGRFELESCERRRKAGAATALDDFRALLADGREPPLLAAAAEVPRYVDPACEPQRVIWEVRAWAEQLRARLPPDASPAARVRLLNHFFFGELGFAGARDEYAAADNSYLHRVIDRRRGIPITLSLLYIELGRAAGLRLHGVSFPGHFLVRLRLNEGAVFIDVFNGGLSLSAADLRERLRALQPPLAEATLLPYLRPASGREILARLLRNLKVIHCRERQWPEALEVVSRLLAVLPDAAEERRDRAQLYARLECPRAAAADLDAYLALRPSPADEAAVRRQLAELQRAASRLN